MRRIFKKTFSVMLAVLLLLPVLLFPACAQEYDHDLCEPTDATVQSFLTCQHIFTTNVVSEFRYISETQHSCYEVEIKACVTCPYMVKKDLSLLYTEDHELGEVQGYEPDGNGDLIFHGICAGCKESVSIYP